MRRAAFLFLLFSLLTFGSYAYAGYSVDAVTFRSAHSLSGSTSTNGTWAGLGGYPRIAGNSDGSFRFTYSTLIAGSAPVITIDQLRVVPRAAVSGANDNIRVTFKCVATPQNAGDTITFPTGRSMTFDLGDLGCAQDQVCNLTDLTAAAIKDNQTGSNCAGTACNNSVLVCEVGIDAGIANEYAGGVDFLQPKYTVTP